MDRLAFFSGFALGAGAMFLLDPDAGARRRARMRDKMVRGTHVTQDFLGKAGRDLRHRARGVAAEARHRFRHEDAPDEVLVERVRSRLGRHTSHPRAIEVAAEGGTVTLSGPILSDEMDGVLRAVRSVPGVHEVENHLEVHERAENLPQLQGGTPPPGEPAEWAQRVWTPGIQLLAVVAGLSVAALAARAIRARDEGADSERRITDAEWEFSQSRV